MACVEKLIRIVQLLSEHAISNKASLAAAPVPYCSNTADRLQRMASAVGEKHSVLLVGFVTLAVHVEARVDPRFNFSSMIESFRLSSRV